MVEGVVKWFSEDKGYGFIEDENQQDFFVHITNIKTDKTLSEGDEVIFDVEKTDRGLAAVNVERNRYNE